MKLHPDSDEAIDSSLLVCKVDLQHKQKRDCVAFTDQTEKTPILTTATSGRLFLRGYLLALSSEARCSFEELLGSNLGVIGFLLSILGLLGIPGLDFAL